MISLHVAEGASRFTWWKSLSWVRLFGTPWTVVDGILQARILEWVPYPFSRGSSQPRDWTQVFHIAGGFFTRWATREAPWSFRQATNYPIVRLGNLELLPFSAEILPPWKRILLFLQGFHYRLKTQEMEIPLVFEIWKWCLFPSKVVFTESELSNILLGSICSLRPHEKC